MEAKAEKYERIRRGDLSGMSEKEIKEAALDVGHPPVLMICGG